MANGRSLAVCDPVAFEPFRRLVEGPLTNARDIEAVERFMRTVVLHDDLTVAFEQIPRNSESYEAQRLEIQERAALAAAAGKPFAPGAPVGFVIAWTSKGIGNERGYGLFCGDLEAQGLPDVELSTSQLRIVSTYSNAEMGDPNYESHKIFLQRLYGVVKQGGSVLCDQPFARAALETATQFPSVLFSHIDTDWKEYALRLQSGRSGLEIPPVLSIVLNNCARRDAIPAALIDLRENWTRGRQRIWALIEADRNAQTLDEIKQIQREFEEASKELSPATKIEGSSPLRMLWNIFAQGVTGATVAGAAVNILGDANIALKVKAIAVGTAASAMAEAAHQFKSILNAKKIFRLGAFDLAGQVRLATGAVTPSPELLSRFLSDSELRTLGYK